MERDLKGEEEKSIQSHADEDQRRGEKIDSRYIELEIE